MHPRICIMTTCARPHQKSTVQTKAQVDSRTRIQILFVLSCDQETSRTSQRGHSLQEIAAGNCTQLPAQEKRTRRYFDNPARKNVSHRELKLAETVRPRPRGEGEAGIPRSTASAFTSLSAVSAAARTDQASDGSSAAPVAWPVACFAHPCITAHVTSAAGRSPRAAHETSNT